jgi:isoleucyl-tRNA synthetase
MAKLYEAVPKIPDFPAMERRILAQWQRERTFERLREKNAGRPQWSFLDGPITANNPMGVHHAWGRTYKDMYQRYHAMNGRDLRYQNGFDCQGLWVEVEVEKELGFATKADIVGLGIDAFVRRCKERVLTFAARQTEQSIRLGYWMDWDSPQTLLALRDALHEGAPSVEVTVASGKTVAGDPEGIVAQLGSPEYGGSYFTFSSENNYTIWHFLKQCHAEGFVYRGTDVMPWCFRCGTGLSQMEVTEGRRITKHTSVFVRFPLRGRDKQALLVWTTTPWTLTSNVAAAVNPTMTYLEVRHGEWSYFVGKGNFAAERVQQLEAGGQRETHKLPSLRKLLEGTGPVEVVRELPGSELLALAYDGPFDRLEAQQRPGGLTPYGPTGDGSSTAIDGHRVIAWDEVSDTDGTGIVHIAPGCGAEDARLGKVENLVSIAPLDDAGRYVEGFGELTGRHVSEVADPIVADLRARSLLVAKEAYPHVYPHCWRCKEELIFRLVDEWFIKMDWRDRIQKTVPEIRWIPPDGEARELDWLRNMGDWMISKKRFWGLALPIWVCESCDAFEVIGGEAELRERAIEGWERFEGHTPHRPWIDAVKIRCQACGGVAERIEDVGNPWLDAGIVPFSTVHYNTDPAYWAKWFPADFVVECFPGQFRNWFYSLLAMSAMLSRRAPFKVLLGHALVRDARGHEMHKSAGNAIAFDDAAEAFGAEVMRYLYAAQNPVQNLNFPDLPSQRSTGKQSIDGEVRAKLLTLWNCYSFFVTYAEADAWSPGGDGVPLAERAELDRWVLSRLQRLIGAAHDAFADFAVHRFMEKLEHFTDELSNWYLRRSRRRFWKSTADRDKQAAYQTLHEVLETLVRVLAPILPFLTEEMYQNLVRRVDATAADSVHLRDYPVVDHARIDDALESRIDTVIRTKNLALALRNQANVRARQPLGKLIVRPRDAHDRAVLSDPHFCEQVLEEINVKALELVDDESGLVTREIKPSFLVLGPRYGKHMKAIAAHLAAADPMAVERAIAGEGYRFEIGGDPIELGKGDVEVRMHGPDHLAVVAEGGTFAALDVRVTPELEQEGIARDFNRQAQNQRKELDLQVGERIRVAYRASARVAQAIERHRDWVQQELLAVTLEARSEPLAGVEIKVGGETVTLAIERA